MAPRKSILRHHAILNATQTKVRKPPIPRIRKRRFLRALEGSAGIRKVIAERLGCSWGTVNNLLNRRGWEDVREAYQDEIEKVGDLAENAIKRAIESTVDLNTATTNARWYLERKCKDRGFGKEEKLVLQGGDKPIEISSQSIPIETLDLPIALKRQILQHLETKKEAQKEDQDEEKEITL